LVSNSTIDNLLISSGTPRTTNVKLAVGNDNNVYVGIENSAGSAGDSGILAGLFRSGDGGNTWVSLDLPNPHDGGASFGLNPGKQGRPNFSIVADPANANIVYIGGDRQPQLNEGCGIASFPNSLGATDFSARIFRIDASKPSGSQFAHETNSNVLG